MPPPLRMKLYLHSKIGGSEFVELSKIEETLKLIFKFLNLVMQLVANFIAYCINMCKDISFILWGYNTPCIYTKYS